jgi:hypothetical protein
MTIRRFKRIVHSAKGFEVEYFRLFGVKRVPQVTKVLCPARVDDFGGCLHPAPHFQTACGLRRVARYHAAAYGKEFACPDGSC